MSVIHWPAILKHHNDAELSCIMSQNEWDTDLDIHSEIYGTNDYLLDSEGNCYSLTTRACKIIQPQLTQTILSLDEVLGLVKAHAAQIGSCCVAKLSAASISDAFKIVRSLNTE